METATTAARCPGPRRLLLFPLGGIVAAESLLVAINWLGPELPRGADIAASLVVAAVLGAVVLHFTLVRPWRAQTAALDQHEATTSAAIELAHRRLEAMFGGHDAVMLLSDAQTGRIVEANPAAQRFYGYPPGVLTTLRIEDINTLAPEAVARARSLAASRGRNSFDFQHRLANGEVRDVEVYSSPIEDDGPPLLFSLVHDVTEQKLAEEALRESEARFRRLVENAPDVLYTFSSKLGGTYYSPRVEELTGYSREYLLAHPFLWNESIHPDDLPEIARVIAASAGKTPFAIEYRLRHADGSWRWVSDRSIEQRLEGDETIIEGLATDITEQKLAEEALRESEARYRLVTDHIQDSVWLLDPEFRFVFITPSVTRDRGFTLEELNRLRLEERMPRAAIEQLRGVVQDLVSPENLASPQPRLTVSAEIETLRKDGTTYWADCDWTLILGDDRKLTGILGTARDVTARREAEHALRESEERYRRLVMESVIPILVHSRGAIQFVNRAFASLWAIGDTESLAGVDIRTLLHPDEREASDQRQRWMTETGQQWPGAVETVGLRSNGESFSIEVSAVGLTLAGEPANVVFVRDLTSQKRAEEERERLHAQFLQAQKMEAVGQLAAGIAHDFNNLLASIVGYSGFAREAAGPDSDAGRDLENVLSAAFRARDLTMNLLTFARMQPANPATVHLQGLVSEVEPLLRPLVGDGISVAFDDEGVPLTVNIDQRQLEQGVLNLASNARDAMPAGGTLRFSLGVESVGAGAGLPQGRYARIRVSDTGVGMPEDVRSRVFEPFFTTKEVGKGTGLGLATCYGIVRNAGGDISVESEPGRGTTFTILLPLVDEEAPRAAEPVPAERMTGGKERVLVAEDDAMLRTLVGRSLRSFGYEVRVVENARAAVALLAEPGDQTAIVVSDVSMPAMNGRELGAWIREHRPGMPVVFVSGFALDSLEGLGEPGKVAFLQKPFDPDVLAATVRRLLDAGA